MCAAHCCTATAADRRATRNRHPAAIPHAILFIHYHDIIAFISKITLGSNQSHWRSQSQIATGGGLLCVLARSLSLFTHFLILHGQNTSGPIPRLRPLLPQPSHPRELQNKTPPATGGRRRTRTRSRSPLADWADSPRGQVRRHLPFCFSPVLLFLFAQGFLFSV